MQSTIGNGERSSASTSYLMPSVRERPNLTILLNTYITRVLPVKNTERVPDIRIVEVAPRAGGTAPLSVARSGVCDLTCRRNPDIDGLEGTPPYCRGDRHTPNPSELRNREQDGDCSSGVAFRPRFSRRWDGPDGAHRGESCLDDNTAAY